MAHNFFADEDIAQLYLRARPTPHREVMRHVVQRLAIARFACALDVGCGTGNSSVALSEFADSVIAVDSSGEMLARAHHYPNIQYVQARAERLPFADATFNFMTVSQALHWFDQPKFFAECRRVLDARGLIAVYNDHFTSVLRGVAAFQRWFRRVYTAHFRRRKGLRDIDLTAAQDAGFMLIERTGLERSEWLARDQMVHFLLTHSNTGSAQTGAREWLESQLLALIPHEQPHEFVFKSNVYLLRSAA